MTGDIAACIEKQEATREAFTLAYETLYQIEITKAAIYWNNFYNRALKSGSDSLAAVSSALEMMKGFYKDYSVKVDRKVAEALIGYYRQNAPEGLEIGEIDLDALFGNSVFTSYEKLSGADAEQIVNDPAMALGAEFKEQYRYQEVSESQLLTKMIKKCEEKKGSPLDSSEMKQLESYCKAKYLGLTPAEKLSLKS